MKGTLAFRVAESLLHGGGAVIQTVDIHFPHHLTLAGVCRREIRGWDHPGVELNSLLLKVQKLDCYVLSADQTQRNQLGLTIFTRQQCVKMSMYYLKTEIDQGVCIGFFSLVKS